jgi:hypothetical protein
VGEEGAYTGTTSPDALLCYNDAKVNGALLVHKGTMGSLLARGLGEEGAYKGAISLGAL